MRIVRNLQIAFTGDHSLRLSVLVVLAVVAWGSFLLRLLLGAHAGQPGLFLPAVSVATVCGVTALLAAWRKTVTDGMHADGESLAMVESRASVVPLLGRMLALFLVTVSASFLLPSLPAAAVWCSGLLWLMVSLAILCGGAVLLVAEWRVIRNRWHLDDASIGDIESGLFFLPGLKRILATLVLTAALPVFAWQAGAQVIELREGSGATVITGSGETLHGAEEDELKMDNGKLKMNEGQSSEVQTATGLTNNEQSISGSGATLSGIVIIPAETETGVIVQTASGALEGQGSGSGTQNQDDTGTGSIAPETSSGSLEGQVPGSGSGTQNQDETGTGSIISESSSTTVILTNGSTVPVLFIPRNDQVNDIETLRDRMSVDVHSSSGITVPVAATIDESGTGFLLTVTPTAAFTPGTATLTVTLRDTGLFGFFGATDELFAGDIILGRLIANADWDTYVTGQQAAVTLSLLSESNDPLCGQDVMSLAASPDGTVQSFSTINDTITTLPKCRHRIIKTDPDYAVTVPITGNATRTVTIDAGSGRAILPLPIKTNAIAQFKRSTVTRTYADQSETMTITITPALSFIGTITERIPAGVEISDISVGGTLERNGAASIITWEKAFEAGTPLTVSYDFTIADAPLVVPFGPVTVKGEGQGQGQEDAESMESASESSISDQPVQVETSTGSTASGGIIDASGSLAPMSPQPGRRVPEDVIDGSETASGTSVPTSSGSLSIVPAHTATRLPAEALAKAGCRGCGNKTIPSRLRSYFTAWISPPSVFAEPLTISATEGRSWFLLVTSSDLRPADQPTSDNALTLTPKTSGTVSASDGAAFTLLDTVIPEHSLDANGHLNEDIALKAIADATTASQDVLDATVSAFVQEQAGTIATTIAEDSVALSEVTSLAPDSSAKRLKANVIAAVTDAMESSDSVQTAVTGVVGALVQDAIDPTLEASLKSAALDASLAGEDSAAAMIAAIERTDPATAALIRDTVNAEAEEKVTEVAAAINEASAPPPPAPPPGSAEQPGEGWTRSGRGGGLIHVTLTSRSGLVTTPAFHFEHGSVILVIEPEREFVPGLYTAEVTITNPLTNETQTLTQDFAWGVLAMNTDQDRYLINQTGSIAIGVLDDEGKIVCNAGLKLSVTAPSGAVTELSSETTGGFMGIGETPASITTTGTCGIKNSMSVSPDYETTLQFEESGTYTLKLEATTENGTREMSQTVIVESSSDSSDSSDSSVSSPFIITRFAATRLYPVGNSPMTIEVKFLEDFSGTITDTVPESFEISGISDGGKEDREGQIGSSDSSDSSVSSVSSEATISWQGSWKSGDTATFSYLYDAPDISPDFFTVGPLELTPDKTSAMVAPPPFPPVALVQEMSNEGKQKSDGKNTGNVIAGGEELVDIHGSSSRISSQRSAMYAKSVPNPMLQSNRDALSNAKSAISQKTAISVNIADSSRSLGLVNKVITGVQPTTLRSAPSRIVTALGSALRSLLPRAIAQSPPIATFHNSAAAVWRESRSWQIANDAVATDSLVGYWKLDESSAGTFIDYSGHNNHGTGYGATGTNNTPQPSSDRAAGFDFTNPKSLSFDGTDDVISTSGAPVITTGDFTLSTWVKSNTTALVKILYIIGNQSSAKGSAYFYIQDASNLVFGVWTVSAPSAPSITPSSVFDGNWHLITGTKTGDTMTLFLDGVQSSQKTVTGINIVHGSPFVQIGGFSSGYFNGLLDDIRIYNRALSPTEIAQLAAGSHTTATWDGSASTDWETAANWDIGAVPDQFTNIIIPDVTNDPHLTASESGASVTVNLGAVLDLHNYTFDITDGGSFKGGGTVRLAGGQTIGGASYTGTGTVLYYGSGSTYNGLALGSTYNNLTINNSLVGYWKLDDGSGSTVARDDSGNGNHGTLTSGPTWSANPTHVSKFYNPFALSFDGGSRIQASITNISQVGSISISTWLKAGNKSSYNVVAANTNGSPSYIVGLTNGSPDSLFWWYNGSFRQSVNSSQEYSDIWHHVIYVYNGSTYKIYEDGSLLNSLESAATININGIWYFGNDQYNSYLKGSLDDVRIYNRALSASEVAALAAGNPNTGSGVYILGSALSLAGNLNIQSGELRTGNAYPVTLSGSFVNHAQFTSTGTVTLDGTNQTISGSTIFQNLTKTVTAADTLNFDFRAKQSISGALTLNGAVGQLLSLRSTKSGSGARLLLDGDAGSQTLSYLNVKDSNATGGAMLIGGLTSTDAGNNTNWLFGSSISGKIYSDEGTTPITSGTVAVSINGGTKATDAVDGGGMYTVTGLTLTGGSIVTVFMDDNAADAVTVTRGSGSSMTGVNLYQNHLIIRSNTGSSANAPALTNANLDIADNSGDSDIAAIYSAQSSQLTAQSSTELYVWTGSQYTPGGRVKSHDLEVKGTMAMGTSGLTLSGSFVASAGTFTTGSGVILNGAEGDSTAPESLTLGANTLQNLTINNGLVGYWKLDDGSGSLIARDDSGNGNHGTWNGAAGGNTKPQWKTDTAAGFDFYNPQSLQFDGVDDYVSFNPALTNLMTSSISIWVYFPVGYVFTNSQSFLGFYKDDNNRLALSADGGSSIYDGKMTWLIVNNGTIYACVSNGTPTTGWHHVVASSGVGGMKLFIDNALQSDTDSATVSLNTTGTTGGRYLGAVDHSSYSTHPDLHFPGLLDDVRIYNRALSASEVAALAAGNPNTGSGLYVLGSALSLAGNLNIQSGELRTGNAYPVTLSGSFVNHAQFTSTGTVTLDGTNQTISGSTIFQNLTKSATAADTLNFDFRAKQSVSGALTLNGAAGQLLSLRSTKTGSSANLLLDGSSGTQNLSYLNVKDNDATGGTMLIGGLTSTDAGNNTNWLLGSSISGKIYSDEGITPITSGTVAVSINGGTKATDAVDGGGMYTVTGLTLTGGSIVTVYIDENAADAVTVTRGSGSSMTGVNLYQNHLILRSNTGSAANAPTLTNTHLNLADNSGDSDIAAIYGMADSNATLQLASGKELYVWAGSQYTPGGRVKSHDLEVKGTMAMGTSGLTLSGSFVASAGTFTTSTGTLLTSKDSTETLNPGSNVTFNNVTINNGLVGYWKLDDGSGSLIARDDSGNGNHGTWNGAATGNTKPQWKTDIAAGFDFYNPQSLQFDGVDDYVNMGNTSAANFERTDPFTIAFWARLDILDNAPQIFISRQDNESPNRGWNIFRYDNTPLGNAQLVFALRSTINTNEIRVQSTDNLWFSGNIRHVTVSYDGSSNAAGINMYIDGVPFASTIINNSLSATTATTQNLQLGAREGNNFPITGLLDDVRIYNRALSASEVAALAAGNPNTGSGVYVLGSALSLSGKLKVESGELRTGNAYPITMSGNVAIGGGALTSTGTVTLDGINQTISGSTIFKNLTKSVTAADTLNFDFRAKQSISGALTLNGAAGQLLSLRSTKTGSSANLLLDGSSGTQNLSYLNVKDNDATGGAMLIGGLTSTDSGNNTNWLFGSSITGKIYSDEGVTPITSGTVAVSINGGTKATDGVDGGGMYTVTGLTLTGGSIVTVFVDDNAADAVTVTRGSGSSMTGVNLYQNHLIIRSNTGSSAHAPTLTNTHLNLADNVGDADVAAIYSMADSNATLQLASGKELYVWTGSQYTPGGRVKSHDLEVKGTMAMGTSGLTLSGSFVASAGTFTTSTGTLLTSKDSIETLNPGSNLTFNNLTINNGLVGYWKLDDGSGSLVARDDSGNGNHGTWNGAAGGNTKPQWKTDTAAGFDFYNPHSLQFDGTDDYVNLSETMLANAQYWSISLWIYNEDPYTDYRSSFGDSLTTFGFPTIRNEKQGNHYQFYAGNGSSFYVNGVITSGFALGNVWEHIVFLYNGADLLVYRQGTLTDILTALDNQTLPPSATEYRIGGGSSASATNFNGLLDDVRIYNRALSASEVAALAAGNPNTGSGVYVLGSALDIDGNLNIVSGELKTGNAQAITVAGNWNNAGKFTSTGAVTLNAVDGVTQTVSGSTVFNGFTKLVTAASNLFFDFRSRQSFSGSLNLMGVEGGLLSLRSTKTGSSSNLLLDGSSGTQNLSYLNVKDSDATGGATLNAGTFSTDSGNNTNWSFPVIPDVYGHVYSNEGITPLAGQTVSISVNGAADSKSVETDASGAFSFTGVTIAAGNVLTLYLEDETADAVTVTMASGSTAMTGVNLFQNRLITRHETGGTLTSTHLDTANNVNDADINAIYTMSSLNTTIVTGKTLYIWTGSTLNLGGTLSVGTSGATSELHINGSLTQNNNVITTYGPYTQSGGTFTGSPGGSAINLYHHFTQDNGVFTATEGILTLRGSFTKTGGTFDAGNGSIVFSANDSPSARSINVDTSETFHDVTFNATANSYGFTIATGDTIIVGGTLTLTNGVVKTGTIDARGDIVQESTADDGGTATINFGNNTLPQTYTVNGGYGPLLRFDNAANADDVLTLAADGGIYGLVVDAGFGDHDIPLSFDNHNLTISSGGYSQAAGAFTASGVLTVIGNFTKTGGTFAAGNGGVVFYAYDSPFARSINVDTSETFHDVTFNATANSYGFTIATGDTIIVEGTLTVINGVVNTGTIDARERIVLQSTADGGTASLTLSGTGSQIIEQKGGTAPSGTWKIAKTAGSATLSGNLVLNTAGQDLTMTGGTLNLNGYNLTVADQFVVGTGTTLRLHGDETITGGPDKVYAASTIWYDAPGGSKTLKTFPHKNVVIGSTGSAIYSLPSSYSVGGNLTISGGTLSAGANTLTVSGSFIESTGTFTAGTSSVILSGVEGDTASPYALTAHSSLNNLTLNNGLVGYWKLDDGSGSLIARDDSGNGNHGTWNGAASGNTKPQWKTDTAAGFDFYNPQSLQFDGVDDYVDFGDPPVLRITQSLTVGTWIKSLDNGGRVIGKWGTNHHSWMMTTTAFPSSKLYFMLGAGTYRRIGTDIDDGSWHYVSAIYNSQAQTLNFYRDGILSNGPLTGTVPTSLEDSSSDNLIAGFDNGGNGYYAATLDDIRIYNRALSASEVAALATGNPNTGSGVYVLGSALDIDGNLNIVSGEIKTANGENITVAGNWKNVGGFTSTGTVILNAADGVPQTVSGSTVFKNFTKLATAASNLFFDFRSQQSFSGSLNLMGVEGELLSLRSTKTGSSSNLLLDGSSGTQNLSYLNVKDNDATGGAELDASDGTSTDSGNNANWTFTPTYSVTGNIYSDEGSTPITSGTVAVSINGGTKATDAVDGGGQYTVTGLAMTGGSIVTVYLDNGASPRAVTVTRGSGSSMTGVHLYQNHLILRSNTGSSANAPAFTNADLDLADTSGDTDISGIYSVTGNALTSNATLLVWPDTTYAPGSAVSSSGITLWGTLSPAANIVTASGTLTLSGGTITATANNITINANAIATVTGSIVTRTSGNITINATGATVGAFVLPAMTSSGSVYVGTVTAPSHITIGGTVLADGENSFHSAGGITQNGTVWSGNGYGLTDLFMDTDNSGTCVFSGGDHTIFAFARLGCGTGGTSALEIHGLRTSYQFSIAGSRIPSTLRVTDDIYAGQYSTLYAYNGMTQDADINIANGTNDIMMNIASDYMGSSTYTRLSGTITANRVYIEQMTPLTVDGIAVSKGLRIQNWNGSGPLSISIIGPISAGSGIELKAQNSLTQSASVTAGSGITIAATDYIAAADITPGRYLDITTTGNYTQRGGTVGAGHAGSDLVIGGNMTLTGGTLTAPAAADTSSFTVGGNWLVNGGNFVKNGGQVTFTGAGNRTISGSTLFHNLTITGSTTKTVTFAAGTTQSVSGALVLQGAADNLLTLTGSLSGHPWYLNVDGSSAQTVTYVRPSRSDASGGAGIEVNTDTGVDGGNNVHWNFDVDDPDLLSFTSDTPDGTYRGDSQIEIIATYDEPLAAGSTITIDLNTGRSVTLSTIQGSTLSGTYTVQAGDLSDDLTVDSITSQSVSDALGNEQTGIGLPDTNIEDGSDIVINAYVTGTGSIFGFVWNDVDGDGVKDAGEVSGLTNVTIDLSGNTVTGAALSLRDTTSSTGAYIFSAILRSDSSGYTVTVSGATLPAGYLRTTASGTGVILGTGASVTANFGFVQASTLSGSVFLDTDNDGVLDASETTVFSGTTLTLTGTSATGGTVSLATRTNASGAYLFENLPTSASGFLLVTAPPSGYEPTTTNSRTVMMTAGGTAATQDVGYRLIPVAAETPVVSAGEDERTPSVGGRRIISVQLKIAGPASGDVAGTDAPADTATEPVAEQTVVTAPPVIEEDAKDAPMILTKTFTPMTIRFRTVRPLGIAGTIPSPAIVQPSVKTSNLSAMISRMSAILSSVKSTTGVAQKKVMTAYERIVLRTVQSTIAWFRTPAPTRMALSPAATDMIATVHPYAVGVIPNSVALTDTAAKPGLELVAKTEQPSAPLLPTESIGAFVAPQPMTPGPSLASVVMTKTEEAIDGSLNRAEAIIRNLDNEITDTANDGVAIAGDGWDLMASGMGRMFDAAGNAGGKLLSYSRSLLPRDNGDAVTNGETQHAAAPEQEYRTTLTKKDDVAVIASLHVSVLNSLGVPYATTPVVLFSTPKIAMTDEEGIATFHDVEVGKHRLEIHVEGAQVESTDIIIEPPSGLSIEEKQSVDVLLPVIRVTVEKQQLHGSAPTTIGLMGLGLILSLSAGIGIGVYVGVRRRKCSR
ncbi:MAG: SdrD B-like domain-containing protein [Candidatus Peribacteraceae bacterium]|nr:SdrD B-like domain-containing protein [Candidatus Peribacteraceae bacterium]